MLFISHAPAKEYNDNVEEWPVEEVPVKVEEEKKEDGGEDSPDKKEDPDNKEEGEEGEKKFNPREFLWTNTNGVPKNLTQIYNKFKPVVWVI